MTTIWDQRWALRAPGSTEEVQEAMLPPLCSLALWVLSESIYLSPSLTTNHLETIKTVLGRLFTSRGEHGKIMGTYYELYNMVSHLLQNLLMF